jgi:hypothetical protein
MADNALADAHQPRKCRAHSKSRKEPCRNWALPGGFVCKFHGGNAPQVKAKAEQRLREMVDPMLSKLHELAMQTDHLPTAVKAVTDALDRAGVGALVQAKVRSSTKDAAGSKVIVNIGFLTKANELPAIEAAAAEVIEEEGE